MRSALLMLIFLVALYGCSKQEKPKVHKFRLPGVYKVYLAKSSYSVWIFTRWTTLGILPKDPKKSSHLLVEIKDLQGKPVKQEIAPSDVTEMFRESSERTGKLRCSIAIDNPGWYTVIGQGEEKAVLALVPPSEVYSDLGSSFRWPGDDDDMGFDDTSTGSNP